MSEGKIPWDEAAAIAERLCFQLRPIVERAKTVGSVRRRKAECGDVEILVEPKMVTVGLFGEEVPEIEPIRRLAESWGTVLKGAEKMIQVQLPEGVNVDLFLCTPPAQFGSLLAIRTGPADLSRHAVTQMQYRGYRHRDGHAETARGELVPTPDEESFFALAGLPCVHPRLRHTPAAYKSLPTPKEI